MTDQKHTPGEDHRTMLDALYTIAKRTTLTRGQSPELALQDIAEFARATILVVENNV